MLILERFKYLHRRYALCRIKLGKESLLIYMAYLYYLSIMEIIIFDDNFENSLIIRELLNDFELSIVMMEDYILRSQSC